MEPHKKLPIPLGGYAAEYRPAHIPSSYPTAYGVHVVLEVGVSRTSGLRLMPEPRVQLVI